MPGDSVSKPVDSDCRFNSSGLGMSFKELDATHERGPRPHSHLEHHFHLKSVATTQAIKGIQNSNVLYAGYSLAHEKFGMYIAIYHKETIHIEIALYLKETDLQANRQF
ncbi:hypothetical protein CEXT_58611 [Caerostris extrusa]|uniref:Uncharacterized protein n=1 Tax=Caerostris extrusa TaxID=172846 RepID=A0AAV4W3N5_CAEEX|nr:hypothetical protein CEXT_58611 [Caerostris extrusa]